MAVRINDYEQFTLAGQRAYHARGFGVTVLEGPYQLTLGVSPGGADKLALTKQLTEQALARLP